MRALGGVLSAVVDGEAGTGDLAALRPHLRNCVGCRATLRALRETRPALQALFPVALVVGAPGAGDAAAGVFVRVYEAVVGGLQERAASTVVKAQALVEATGAAKVTAVAASAAAVAGGGAATVERVADRPEPRPARAEVRRVAEEPRVAGPAPKMRVVAAARTPAAWAPARTAAASRPSSTAREERRRAAGRERRAAPAPEEFGVAGVESAPAARPVVTTAQATAPAQPAPTTSEFSTPPPSRAAAPSSPASTGAVADEFGPEG